MELNFWWNITHYHYYYICYCCCGQQQQQQLYVYFKWQINEIAHEITWTSRPQLYKNHLGYLEKYEKSEDICWH